jgi:oxygen-independent coproporphyrinogen III oxidase
MSAGIYIHIPFCDTKCIYCDFYSITDHSKKSEFIASLIKEIQFNSKRLIDYKFDTIFIGGGTPSLISYDEFQTIFKVLYNSYNISGNTEITIEANPGTINKEKLNQFKSLPINRLSFGVQSFIDSDLKFLTRIHTAEGAINSIKDAQDAGYNNMNIDLIFGIPGQTIDDWKYNLEKALTLNIQHISAYSLIFEDDTYLNDLFMKKRVNKIDEETEIEMYYQTMECLESCGFKQYEVSNYSIPGLECKHNLKYWDCNEYIGFGPSAAGYINQKRTVNTRNIQKYIELIQSKKNATEYTEEIDREKAMSEFIFLGLRSRGVNLKIFENKFNQNFNDTYADLIRKLITNQFAYWNGDKLSLTKKGYALCDEIATYF